MPEARDFFETVFGDTDDASIYLFTTPEKQCLYYPCNSEGFLAANARIDELHSVSDVYAGVGCVNAATVKGHRPSAKDIISIPGLWADIDCGKPGFPDTREAAVDLIDRAGVPKPSLLVNSGHGLQGWWLFREMLDIPDDKTRGEVGRLVVGFQDVLRAALGAMDSTHDLARILRIPGTTNHKHDEKAPVEQWSSDDVRYNPDDFDAFISEQIPSAVDTSGVNVTFDPAVNVPTNIIVAISAVDDKFAKVWARTWDSKWTQSQYDQSIATTCAKVNMTDDQIAATIAHHRMIWDQKPKNRKDYLELTIATARATAVRLSASEYVDGYEDWRQNNPEAVEQPKPGSDTQDATLEALRFELGITITGVIKYMSEPPIYALQTEFGSVHIGEIADLISQIRMRGAIASIANRVIPGINPRQWTTIAQMLLDVRTEIEIGEESTDEGRAWSWIKGFAQSRAIAQSKDEPGVAERGIPYMDDGLLHIFPGAVRTYIKHVFNENVTNIEFGRLMRCIGFRPKTIRVTSVRGATTANVWRGDVSGRIEPNEG